MARALASLFDRYRRRGDVAALGRVFDRTAPEILRVAMHFARHPAEAEDLLQETFLTAIACAEGYDATRPLVPWLIGILRNHARRLHRQRRREPGTAHEASHEQATDDAWMEVAWSDAVAEALEGLPDPYRQVLVLRLRHDRSPAEIAALLDLPPATVRSQIHRGLDLLRRRLPPEARSRALLALPFPAGLAGVRQQVLARGAEAACAAGTATSTLPVLEGLLMTKKSTLLVGAILAALLAGGSLWLGGVLDAPEQGGPGLPPTRGGDTQAAGRTETTRGPGLEGRSTPAPARPADAPVEPPGEATWPPRREIPADKGSVAGTIRFEDGTPLVGATVALWGSPCVPATTDGQGRYHIHADWVSGRSVYLRLGKADQPTWLGLILSGEVAMRNGELVLHDITLERGVDVASAVVDARSDKPVADAKVVLRSKTTRWGQGSSGFGITDADGRFAFPYVPRGAYTLELQADGYEARVHEVDLTSGALPPSFGLEPSRPLVIRFTNLPEGAAGTKVTCDLAGTDVTSFSVSQHVTIASDGTVTLDAPEPGTYRLTIFRSSHLPRLERGVRIPPGPLEPIEWILEPGARVLGRILDAQGEPIAHAQVGMGGAAGRPRTDDEGSFEFPYAPAGTRGVEVLVGTAWVRLGRVDVPREGSVRLDLRVPGSSVLRGRFLVDGVPVTEFSGAIEVRTEPEGADVATARADAQGGFAIPHLAAGRYQLYGWAEGGVPAVRVVEVARGEEKDVGDVDLEALLAVPVRFVLPAGMARPRNLWVHAFDASVAESLHAPSVMEVGGRRLGVAAYVKQDDAGQDQVAGLPRGRHRLRFMAEGLEPTTIEVEVRPGMTQSLEVRLEPQRADR